MPFFHYILSNSFLFTKFRTKWMGHQFFGDIFAFLFCFAIYYIFWYLFLLCCAKSFKKRSMVEYAKYFCVIFSLLPRVYCYSFEISFAIVVICHMNIHFFFQTIKRLDWLLVWLLQYMSINLERKRNANSFCRFARMKRLLNYEYRNSRNQI